MLTIYKGIQFDFTAYVVDGANNPVDLSLASSVTLTVGNSAPIIGAAASAIGYAVFPLTLAVVSNIGTFDMAITYIINGISETTFKSQLQIIQRPRVATLSVVSGAPSTAIFELQDTNGSPLNLTNSVVQLFDKPSNTAAAVPYPFTILNAAGGTISVTYTQAATSFGYFLVDNVITAEFMVNPVT